MDFRLYENKLINHQIFKDIKESLNQNVGSKLRNLINIRDDVLYLWNSLENCIFALNLKHLEENEGDTKYQKLHFITPPQYQVERVISSGCGSRLCVWGSRGVTVAELPARWGRGGLFDSGSQIVLCKSQSLDERFLYSQAEVRRVHWHPSSLSHLLVLVSDNTIRLYNIVQKTGPKLLKVYPIGAKPVSSLGKTILDSLGDTAVDFTVRPNSDDLLILRGNGDVVMLNCDLSNKSSSVNLQGPLSMYPPADDNYGTDSCCIECIGSNLNIVLVATSAAKLYHCLLLPTQSEKNDEESFALYVVESVELNISLNPDDTDMQYNYPVQLLPCSSSTYACIHAGGVHTVTLPLVDKLTEYAVADEDCMEQCLSSLASSHCTARHAVFTGTNVACAPQAATLYTRELLLLCDDASVIVRTLDPFDIEEELFKEIQLKNPALEQDEISNILKEKQKLSFTKIIQDILTREVSQPIMNVNNKEGSNTRQCLEVATSAILKLRTQYMLRQEQVLEATSRKLRTMNQLNKQQVQWGTQIKNDIDEVKTKSEALRDKCCLAEKIQDDLKYRCSSIIRLARGSLPASAAERELIAELEHHKRSGEKIQQDIALLKNCADRKHVQLKEWQEEYKKKDIALGKSHSDTISSVLQQQTSQISTLIEETKLLKDQLNIV